MSWSKLGGWRELGVSWSKGSKLGGWRELGASWSKLGGWRELGASWSELEQAGASWSKLGGWRELGASWEQAGVRGVSWEAGEPASACSHLAHSPLPPRGSRDPGILWEQGEQAGSDGSKLEARGVSWGLPEAPGRFQGPRDLV